MLTFSHFAENSIIYCAILRAFDQKNQRNQFNAYFTHKTKNLTTQSAELCREIQQRASRGVWFQDIVPLFLGVVFSGVCQDIVPR
ncbi:hypothetical protein QP141_06905, partial [Alloscardovia omnicolens]|nr:hypothetical protein [Alloscardovia omnicolens]